MSQIQIKTQGRITKAIFEGTMKPSFAVIRMMRTCGMTRSQAVKHAENCVKMIEQA